MVPKDFVSVPETLESFAYEPQPAPIVLNDSATTVAAAADYIGILSLVPLSSSSALTESLRVTSVTRAVDVELVDITFVEGEVRVHECIRGAVPAGV